VVNLLGVIEPMVGWKWAPFPVVASCYLVMISVSILYALNWELIGAFMSLLICNWFCIEKVKLCIYIGFLEELCLFFSCMLQFNSQRCFP
jgi:hypothetical protein